jgi:hypothetical protein
MTMIKNVRIYRPSRNPMQSGRTKTESWVLEYETPTPRKPGGVMNWTGSGDTLNQVKIKFPTSEEAVRFATGKGWAYQVQPAQDRKVLPRNYVDNFRYIPAQE